MTDRQLAVYLGIIDSPKWPEVVASLTANQRAVYERMSRLETEIQLWQEGLGPKPSGVLIDGARTPAQARGRVERLRKRAQERLQ